MQQLKKYELNYKKTQEYFQKSLKGVNELSNSVVSFLQCNTGNFFTLLPEGISEKKIHEFEYGGKTSCVRDEIAIFIKKLIESRSKLTCIFDDFDADFKDKENIDLYRSNGFHYINEIYYAVQGAADKNLIDKCLQYSNAIWHSLCVITEFSLESCENRILGSHEIKMISENSVLIMLSAYDAEGYVFWERN